MPSNEETAYARNRVRHGLAAALAEVHPAAAANVLRTAELLRDEAEVLDALAAAELDGSGAEPRDAISLERLGELPVALRRLVVQQLADRAAGRPVPGAARHAEEVAALRRTGTAMLDLGSGVRAVVERGVLRAERVERRARKHPYLILCDRAMREPEYRRHSGLQRGTAPPRGRARRGGEPRLRRP